MRSRRPTWDKRRLASKKRRKPNCPRWAKRRDKRLMGRSLIGRMRVIRIRVPFARRIKEATEAEGQPRVGHFQAQRISDCMLGSPSSLARFRLSTARTRKLPLCWFQRGCLGSRRPPGLLSRLRHSTDVHRGVRLPQEPAGCARVPASGHNVEARFR
jgi:hypothetical protein